jgi:hypothetical protein
MNGEEERPSARRGISEYPGQLAALAQIEAVERFVSQQYCVRRQQPHPDQRALTLPL